MHNIFLVEVIILNNLLMFNGFYFGESYEIILGIEIEHNAQLYTPKKKQNNDRDRHENKGNKI